MRYRMKNFIAISILGFLTLGFFACTEKEPIHLGFVGGLSGRVADLGTAGRNGATLAIEQQNSLGKIHGRKIKLLTVDDKQSPETAVETVEKLISEGVFAIIGPMTSSMAVEMVPQANQEKVVMISPTANTQQLAGIDDYFFRVISSTGVYAEHLAGYLHSEKKLKHVSIIYDLKNQAFTESFQEGFKSSFEKSGGKVTRVRTFTSGSNVSFLELTQGAIGPETEGILVLANALDAALICQQVKKIAPSLIIAGTGWSATEKLIQMGGSAVEGIYLQQFFDRDSSIPRYAAFRDAYLGRFGEEPGFASVAGYDAANLLITALKNTEDNRALKQTIINTAKFEGVQQPISIDRFGDATRTPYISTVRDGRFVVLN